MLDLYTFLDEISSKSDFNAKLSERGGYITFSIKVKMVRHVRFRRKEGDD